jgi:putative zincin peptidase
VLALFAARWGWPLAGRGLVAFLHYRVAAPAMVLGILAHEAIHAIAWAIASGRPLRAIDVGVQWCSLTPFAHPREPMAAAPYRVGAAMPGLVLGILPALAGIIMRWPVLLVFGLVFTMAAGGDLVVLWLIRGIPRSQTVQDHPTGAGCIVLD